MSKSKPNGQIDISSESGSITKGKYILKPIVGIYGYGRFGRFWANELKKDFEIWAYSKSNKRKEAAKDGVQWVSAEKILTAPTIYFCVPINLFGSVLKKITSHLHAGQVIIDTCSVKEMPAQLMEKYAPKGVEIIATHPMFGPDSGKGGIAGLPFVYYPLRVSKKTMDFWKKYWKGRGLRLIELSPKEHDKQAAYSQGVAHYLARVLHDMKLERTSIDVKGFSALMDMKEILGNDTWELFNDLQQNNRYTKQMRLDFLKSMKKIYYRLFPKQVHPDYLTIGVQGDIGSYSELACKIYCKHHQIENYKIKYLINAEPVLKALYRGDIDRGIIAIQNAQGGVVLESVNALSEYNAYIHELFGIVINHCLMVRPGTEKIITIVSHEQALKQCRDNIAKLYPEAMITPYRDTALAARKLAKGGFPEGTAVIAPRTAASYYKLEIVHQGIQDLGTKNITDFLFLSNRL